MNCGSFLVVSLGCADLATTKKKKEREYIWSKRIHVARRFDREKLCPAEVDYKFLPRVPFANQIIRRKFVSRRPHQMDGWKNRRMSGGVRTNWSFFLVGNTSTANLQLSFMLYIRLDFLLLYFRCVLSILLYIEGKKNGTCGNMIDCSDCYFRLRSRSNDDKYMFPNGCTFSSSAGRKGLADHLKLAKCEIIFDINYKIG